MVTMTVGEFKTHFSEVIEKVRAGEEIIVTYGKNKEVIGHFLPPPEPPKGKRQLGILEGKATVIFGDDFKMTGEELLGL